MTPHLPVIKVGMARGTEGGFSFLDEQNNSFTIADPMVSFNDEAVMRYVEKINVSPGLTTYIIDMPPETEFSLAFESDDSPLEFGFCISGKTKSTIENMEHPDSKMAKSRCFISRIPDSKGTSSKQAGEALRAVSICLDPTLLRIFIGSNIEFVKPEFLPYLEKNSKEILYTSFDISSSMQACISNIINCRYTNPLRKIFLAGKINELVSLMIMDFVIGRAESPESVLQPCDIDNVIAARDIMLKNLDSPPSIAELAKRVCLNEFKLKKGFKEIFGTTVFGYARREKMEQARTMLDSGKYTVSQIAWGLGFTNVSHFIAVFRKHHGVNPGSYLQKVKKELRSGFSMAETGH